MYSQFSAYPKRELRRTRTTQLMTINSTTQIITTRTAMDQRHTNIYERHMLVTARRHNPNFIHVLATHDHKPESSRRLLERTVCRRTHKVQLYNTALSPVCAHAT